MRDNSVDAFFALVRAGLWGKVCANHNVDLDHDEKTDWWKVYRLAQEQSVQGVVLQGIEWLKKRNNLPGSEGDTACGSSGSRAKSKLACFSELQLRRCNHQRGANLNANEGLTNSPQVSINIPQALLLKWIGEVQLIEQRNREMNAVVAELFDKLRNQGVETLLVKGQGVAQCYERPLWRIFGDIDLYLNEDDFQKAKAFFRPFVNKFEPDNGHSKHINMHYSDWVVEIHADQKCTLSPRINRVMNDVHQDIFFHGKIRSWQNQGMQIFLPSADNDIIIVFTHFLKHFYKGGLGLRQICDWCRLLYKYRDSLDYILLEQRLRKAGLMDEWRAFGAFSVEYLGLPIEAIPFYVDSAKWQRKANKISEFILEVGNFGHNRDTSNYGKYPFLVRKAISFDRRLKDLIRHAKIFPMDSVRFFFGIMYNGIVSAIRGE